MRSFGAFVLLLPSPSLSLSSSLRVAPPLLSSRLTLTPNQSSFAQPKRSDRELESRNARLVAARLLACLLARAQCLPYDDVTRASQSLRPPIVMFYPKAPLIPLQPLYDVTAKRGRSASMHYPPIHPSILLYCQFGQARSHTKYFVAAECSVI